MWLVRMILPALIISDIFQNMFVKKTCQSLLLLLGCLILFTQCDSKRFYDENAVVKNGIWNNKDLKIFDVTISDTLSRYNFFLNIRNDGNYPFSNLYLFIHTTFPDGHKAIDTVECQLADYDGKWRGQGMGSLKFNRFEFQRGVRLAKPGKYSFALEQAMRVDDLKGIRDIGIRIEKEIK